MTVWLTLGVMKVLTIKTQCQNYEPWQQTGASGALLSCEEWVCWLSVPEGFDTVWHLFTRLENTKNFAIVQRKEIAAVCRKMTALGLVISLNHPLEITRLNKSVKSTTLHKRPWFKVYILFIFFWWKPKYLLPWMNLTGYRLIRSFVEVGGGGLFLSEFRLQLGEMILHHHFNDFFIYTKIGSSDSKIRWL